MGDHEDEEDKIQATAVPLDLLKRYNAKNKITQLYEDDKDLVPLDDGSKKKKKRKSKSRRKKVKSAIEQPKPRASEKEKLVVRTGTVELKHAIEVDLKAYKSKLRTLRDSHTKEGNDTETEHYAMLLKSLDQRHFITAKQLTKIYQLLGDNVVPEPVLEAERQSGNVAQT